MAAEVFAAWQVEVARTRWLGAPPPPRTHAVQELITEYQATVTPRKSPDSQRRDRLVLARFPTRWGAKRLDEVTGQVLEAYLTVRLEVVTLATASKELGILKSACARAVRWGWLAASPFRGLALNHEGEERLRWLTHEEEQRLLTACAPWLREIVAVGLDTGLRRGNLVGLQWAWVQEQGTVLVVPRPHVKAKKREGFLRPPRAIIRAAGSSKLGL